MTPLLTLTVVGLYIALLFVVARLSARNADNESFFSGSHRQRGWVVALSMVGAPMTGVTFISVPGSVGQEGFSYMQMVLGFIVGSVVIATLLIPLYYKYRVTSLYEYLDARFGVSSHATGAWLFFLSKMLGASLRVFVACVVLQQLLCAPLGIPMWVTVLLFMLAVWLYTHQGGVTSVVWTDVVKTLSMVASVVVCLVVVLRQTGFSLPEAMASADDMGLTQMFFTEDWNDSRHFVKMFLAGVFMIVAMTGLDQDMMQRALASRSQRTAQCNMVVASVVQAVVIALLLMLGAMLYLYTEPPTHIAAHPDEMFAYVATQTAMPSVVGVLLVLGVLAATFSSTGGALTSLTTSFTIDILRGRERYTDAQLTRRRKVVHLAMMVVMMALVLLFGAWRNESAINIFYRMASYTYGPLLGMFAFGVASKREVRDAYVPVVAVVAPLLSFVLDSFSEQLFAGYRFGFEILLLNAGFTVVGLFLLSQGGNKPENS